MELRPLNAQESLNLRNQTQSLGGKRSKNTSPGSECGKLDTVVNRASSRPSVYTLVDRPGGLGGRRRQRGWGHEEGGGKKQGVPVPVRSRDKS